MKYAIAVTALLAVPACKQPAEPAPPAVSTSGQDDGGSESGRGTTSTDDGADSGGNGNGNGGSFALAFEEIEVDGGLSLTTELRFVPGTMELLALSKSGRVDHYRLSGDTAAHLGGWLVPGVYSDLDCGLLSLAFDPDFDDNGYIYLATCVSLTHSAIVRATFDPNDYDAIPASQAEILVAGDAAATKPWHNIGQLGFDSSGYLWALLGDKRVSANGQDSTNNLSALIRIDPNREPDGSGYLPAPGNPFADGRGGSPDVYAIGLRSPWRGVHDSFGRWWFGDVGANAVEEINLVTAPGQNFGWAAHEGPCDEDCGTLVDPIVAWEHEGTHPYQIDDPDVSSGNARVAWVGVEYTGTFGDRYDGALTGTVLFGDYCQGYVRGLAVNGGGEIVSDRHLGHLRLPTSWTEAPDGFIYASTFGKCETAGLDEDDPPPSQLFRAVAAK